VRFFQPVNWLSPEVLGTSGYYISREAAKRLLNSTHLETVADHWSLWARRAKGKIFVSEPAIVIHPSDLSDSDIEKSRITLIKQTAAMNSKLNNWWRYFYLGAKARIMRYLLRPIAEWIL
jgi:hypothetical protein